MPVTIPYEPGLMLGTLLSKESVISLKKISGEQEKINQAKARYTSAMKYRRSLEATLLEMVDMGVDDEVMERIRAQLGSLTQEINQAASMYGQVAKAAQGKIAKIWAQQPHQKKYDATSPVDYAKSLIRRLPLSSHSLTMNIRNYQYKEQVQNGEQYADTIRTQTAAHVGAVLGCDRGAEMASAAKQALLAQLAEGEIKRTVVFAANCTHRQVGVIAPFVLDVDKAVHVWNEMYEEDAVEPLTRAAMEKIVSADQPDGNALNILSEATYGSSFVGMLYMLDQNRSVESPDMRKLAADLQTKMEAGGWFAAESGRVGVDEAVANSVKDLLFAPPARCHATVLTMGAVPAMRPGIVTLDVNPGMEESGLIGSMGESRIQQSSGVDLNWLMGTLDDFMRKVIGGEGGVPVEFSVRSVTKRELAKAWIEKYSQPTVAGYDDLTRIEGIGPKISGLLKDAGYRAFSHVAEAGSADLRQILAAGGPRYNLADPTTWPEQASLAAAGKWQDLEKLQKGLKVGRR